MENIGLFTIYILVWLLCIITFIKDRENFLALIGLILTTIFLPSMFGVFGVV